MAETLARRAICPQARILLAIERVAADLAHSRLHDARAGLRRRLFLELVRLGQRLRPIRHDFEAADSRVRTPELNYVAHQPLKNDCRRDVEGEEKVESASVVLLHQICYRQAQAERQIDRRDVPGPRYCDLYKTVQI
jgi:hypothetical protein